MSVSDPYYQAFVRLRSHTTGQWLVPEELRPKLVADTIAKESNLTEVVIGILAQRYIFPFEPTGRRTEPNPNGEELNLRLPIGLYQRIAQAAARKPRTVQREILATLCAHYGLVLPPVPKQTRRRRRAAAPRAAAS